MFFLKVTFLSLCFIFGGVHGQEPCQSLLAAETNNPGCVALGNCTGMTCSSVINDAPSSTTFVVDKCTDPLVVSVSVNNGSYSTQFLPTAIGLQEITAGDLTIQFNVTRNASTAWIQASSGGNAVIPPVSVPLNQTDCMCESLSDIADSLTITEPIETSCMVSQMCSGIECGLSLASFTFYVEVDLQPCEKPPGILLVVRNSAFEAIYEGYFNSSDVVSAVSEDSVAIQVNVMITHLNYSMVVEVDVTAVVGPFNVMVPIVGPAQVIVDKTQCSTNMVPFVPAPPSEAVSSSTCMIITNLAGTSKESGSFLQCNAKGNCDGMTCGLGDYYTTDIQALACSIPPRFYVKVTRITTLVFSGIITETTTVDLGTYGQLQIPIIDYGDEISIEVDLLTGFLNFNAPLSPLLRIPKDYCLCSNANCPTSPTTEAPTRESTTEAASSANSSGVAVAVTVPIIFLVLIIVLVLAGIIGLLIWRQQKLQFSFQQMKNQDNPLVETFHKASEEADNADDSSDYK